MDDEKIQIDPQMQAILKPLWDSPEEEPDWDRFGHNEVIAMRAEAMEALAEAPRSGPELPRVVDLDASGAFGKTRVRLYDPSNSGDLQPALIFLHGGGWFGGSIEGRDGGCRLLADLSNQVVLSVGYALAPEHKFPGPLNDVLAVCRWLRAHADELGIDPQRLAIGGDSAGANLALATALDLRNSDEQFLCGLLLFYGVFAHDHQTPSHRRFGKDGRYTLSSAAMDFCWRMYLNAPDEDQDPRAAPLLADLTRLPPAYIMCGSLDPLLNDSRNLYEKMKQAGVDCTLRIHEGVPHSFLSYFSQVNLAREAWREAADFLRSMMV